VDFKSLSRVGQIANQAGFISRLKAVNHEDRNRLVLRKGFSWVRRSHEQKFKKASREALYFFKNLFFGANINAEMAITAD
jgi:hypothetical protein